jgi:hypothetical protein
MGLEYFYDSDTVVAFAGPPDPNSEGWNMPSVSDPTKYMLLLHPAYKGRDKQAEPLTFMPHPSWQNSARAGRAGLQILPGTTYDFLTSMQYDDPAVTIDPNEFGGRWLASFAPVGSTQFVVVVQKRYNSITNRFHKLVALVLWSGSFAVGGCCLMMLIVMIARADRGRKRAVAVPG